MIQEKATKNILEEKLKERRRTPLFNPRAIAMIDQRLNKWKTDLLTEKDRIEFSVPLYTIVGSKDKIPRPLLNTAADLEMDYFDDLGLPGEEPFTRGIHANMYRGKTFTIRQLAGFGGPEDTNVRMKFLLEHGVTGLNIVFDLPTIQEYDSDDPKARGQVGFCGVAIDTVDDIEILFRDIPIDKISVSLVTHYPTNTAILFAMYLALAEKRKIPWSKLAGSVQNDLIMECAVRTAPEQLPPHACFRIQCDNAEFIRKNAPLWNYATFNGYNLREAGVDDITEISVAILNAIETFKELIKRGHNVDEFADRAAFFWSIGSDFFGEIARLRGARRLWYRIMKHVLGAKDPRSMWMRFHVQTSGVSLTRDEPSNNIVRAAYQALSSVLGGCQSLHVDSYDESYSVPTETAALISLRTQQVIQEETGVREVVDPLGGSYYVEWLTNQYEQKILETIDELESLGGIVAAIEKGWLHTRIIEFACNEQKQIEQGRIKLVGVNIHKTEAAVTPAIDVFRYPEGVEKRQSKKLENVRRKRDNKNVESLLEELRKACKRRDNIFPYVLEAVREYATIGEIAGIFREVYGTWKPLISL